MQTYGEGVDHPVVPNGDSGLEAITLAFLESKLNTDAGSIKYRGGYAGESGKYAYVSQMVVSITKPAFRGTSLLSWIRRMVFPLPTR